MPKGPKGEQRPANVIGAAVKARGTYKPRAAKLTHKERSPDDRSDAVPSLKG